MALQYQQVGTEIKYREETQTVEQDLGYEVNNICKPAFIFFEFVGLRPSTPHWIFFDGVDVTKWINTSYNLDTYNNSAITSKLRTPGDTYIDATAFPTAQGGPTNASGPINSDAAGTISGAFYLQSNDTLSFKIGTRVMTAIDISILDKSKALSYAQAEFYSTGVYEVYTENTVTSQVAYDVPIYDWVTVADPPPPPNNSSNDNDNGSSSNLIYSHYESSTNTVTTWKDGITWEDAMKIRSQSTVKKENRFGWETGVFDHTNSGGGGGGGSSQKAGSGGCCFIMLEARYGNGTMDKVVRRYRDEYMTDRNRRGYYRLAEVLVPLMRKSKVFKWVVTKTFADPLVAYGKYYYGENKYGIIFTPVKNFWMKVFDIVGGETKFIRENGEVV